MEAIDLKYDGDDDSEHRWADVQRETEFVRRIVTAVVLSKRDGELGYAPELLASIKH